VSPAEDQAIRPLMLGMGWFPDQKGGLNRYFTALHGELRRQGVDAHAVVLGPAADAPASVHVAAPGEASLARRISGFARAARRLRDEVDVVDVHFALYGLAPLLVHSWGRAPLVVHFQGPWAAESTSVGDRLAPRVWIKQAIERTVYRRARELVVLSGAFKRVLVETYGVSPSRVRVIPPGVDLERFVPASRERARAELGLGADAFTVVVARRLVPRMGIEVLVKAWSAVASAAPGARLVVVGDGPQRGELERLASRGCPDGSVDFLGTVDEDGLRTCYAAANLMVVPSTELEGYGLVVLEALAMGRPVVVSDAGGLPEAVAALDPSLVVPAGDAEALAARILAAADGSRPLPAPEVCRRHAESFSWQRVAERNREVYAAAVDRGP
jgi:glycosyltransferase involved in cell wall biosynthesis